MVAITSHSTGAIRQPGRFAGRVLSGLAIAFLTFDGLIKLIPIAPVTETLSTLGWPDDAATARGLGVLTLMLTALYAWARTATLGAVLLTGNLGGAVATHARIGSPMLSHTLFGVYVGVVLWAGLWLRDARLRALAG